MSNIGDEQLSLAPGDLAATRKRASIFKKESKKCNSKEMKADYFNFLCGSPKDQAELYWALEADSEYDEFDEDMEEFLDYIRELPLMKYSIELCYNMSVLFKRAWANFMDIMMSTLQTAANNLAISIDKKEKKDYYTKDDGSFVKKGKRKLRNKGDNPFGEKDKDISTKVETTVEKDRSPKPKVFAESEATRVSRVKPGKGGNGCVTFGWGDSGDSFFSGMSFNEPEMFFGP